MLRFPEEDVPNSAACTGESLLSMLTDSIAVIFVNLVNVDLWYSRVLVACNGKCDQFSEGIETASRKTR
jgi:hypothetical protein